MLPSMLYRRSECNLTQKLKSTTKMYKIAVHYIPVKIFTDQHSVPTSDHRTSKFQKNLYISQNS